MQSRDIITPDDRIVCGYLITEVEPLGEFPTTSIPGGGTRLKDGQPGRLEIWTKSEDGRMRSTGRRIDVVNYLAEGRWPAGSFAVAKWSAAVGDHDGEWQLLGTVRAAAQTAVGSGFECGCSAISGLSVEASVSCAKCNGSFASRVLGIGVGSLQNVDAGLTFNPTPQASEFFVEYVSDCIWRSGPLVWSIPGPGSPSTWTQVACEWELDLDQSPPRLLLDVEGVGEIRYEMSSPSFNCNGPTSFRLACSENRLAVLNIPCIVCITPQVKRCVDIDLPPTLNVEFLTGFSGGYPATPLDGLTVTLNFGTNGTRLRYYNTLNVGGITAEVEWLLCEEQLSVRFPCANPATGLDYSITTGTAVFGLTLEPTVDTTFFASVSPISTPLEQACAASPWNNCGYDPTGTFCYYNWRARMTTPP